MKRRITALVLNSLKAEARPYYVSDEQQTGLRVRVAPSGATTWNLAYRIKGAPKAKSVSLGPCDPNGRHGLGIAEARERAATIIKAARQGVDLIAEEAEQAEAKRSRLTVAELIERYAKAIKSPHRNGGALRTADDIERRLVRALRDKSKRPAESIQRSDVSELLDRVAAERPREAEKRRQVIGAMYRWGITKGYVHLDPTDGTESYGRGEPRDRALSADEIRAFWRWLDDGAGRMPPDVIAALRLQLCTGARIGEIAGITASELRTEGERLLWELPASRSKNKTERLTPLVGTARSIVEETLSERGDGALFRAAMSDRALTASDVGHALKQRKLPVPKFGSHDLRRTVVSGMDELGIALDTIAATIGHQRGTKGTRTLIRHYSRAKLDDRIELALAAWDARLTEIIEGKQPTTGGNVIQMRR